LGPRGEAADPAAGGPAVTVSNVFLRLGEDIELPAREAGVLAELPVADGGVVEAGAVLARVEDDEAKLLRDRAALDVEVARREADLAIDEEYARKARGVAEAELARAERSRSAVAGAVSLTEVGRLRLEVEKADAEVRRIERQAETARLTVRLKEAERALAELRLERHKVVAPVAAQVVEHYRDRGEWVEPGAKVLRLIRLDVLRAEGYVDAAVAAKGLAGAPVSFRAENGGPAKAFAGKVVFVSPEVEPTTGQVLVRAEIENAGLALRPGLRGEMSVMPVSGSETRRPAGSDGETSR
jgi:multidrug efflux pump subunit AcrA (membrane-fusion protein)